MNNNGSHLIPAVVGQIISAIGLVSVAILSTIDRRSARAPVSRRFSSRSTQWHEVIANALYHEGWFVIHLRCNYQSFLEIAESVKVEWNRHYRPLHHNAVFDVKIRLAVCIHYFSQGCALSTTAALFGMSTSTAQRSVEQISKILSHPEYAHSIRLPKGEENWRCIADGFEEIAGFPGVCGAIDGSLIEIERPYDHEGWYCRKGFPAVNVQVVVDHKRRFMSYCMLPGSANDKSVFRKSRFGKKAHRIIPVGCHFLGDSGYQIMEHVMTPYDLHVEMPLQEAHYNLLHSRTRITVEGALGLLKSRFRILHGPLNQKSRKSMKAVVHACLVLHNWMINLKDSIVMYSQATTSEDQEQFDDDESRNDVDGIVTGNLAREKRDRIQEYLWSLRNY